MRGDRKKHTRSPCRSVFNFNLVSHAIKCFNYCNGFRAEVQLSRKTVLYRAFVNSGSRRKVIFLSTLCQNILLYFSSNIRFTLFWLAISLCNYYYYFFYYFISFSSQIFFFNFLSGFLLFCNLLLFLKFILNLLPSPLFYPRFAILIFPSASAIRRYPVLVLQTTD